jgi:hypothetical protein
MLTNVVHTLPASQVDLVEKGLLDHHQRFEKVLRRRRKIHEIRRRGRDTKHPGERQCRESKDQ